MKLVSQLSYRSPEAWRPAATIIEENSIGLWGVCFSWGSVDLAPKVLENVRFFVDACLNQSEITNPFGYQTGLSSLENALRAGCALSNDVIFRLVNKSQLTGGAECALFAKRGRELAILQFGQPHIFLLRHQKVIPLITGFDFLPSDTNSGLFLPSQLLGTQSSCYPSLRSFQYEKGDSLILLAHSQLPGSILFSEAASKDDDLRGLFQIIAQQLPRHPFWLAKVRL